MHIDLIELFRCPRPHEESWLVASFDRMAGRHVTEGRLGCPVCRAEYPIEGGILRFQPSETAGRDVRRATDAASGRRRAGEGADADGDGSLAEDEEALRLAAILDLADGGGVVVLSESWSEHAAKLAMIVEDIHLLLHDPTSVPASGDTGSISAIASPGRLPLAAGAVRAVALGTGEPREELWGEAARSLRERGRLVAPVGSALPEGVVELARDERVWVAERRERPRLVSLGRGGRS